MIILQELPMQAQIVETGASTIAAKWKQANIKKLGAEKATALVAAAKRSAGNKAAPIMARNELTILLADYQHKSEQYEYIKSQIKKLQAKAS